jgi:hypothetical protein
MSERSSDNPIKICELGPEIPVHTVRECHLFSKQEASWMHRERADRFVSIVLARQARSPVISCQVDPGLQSQVDLKLAGTQTRHAEVDRGDGPNERRFSLKTPSYFYDRSQQQH